MKQIGSLGKRRGVCVGERATLIDVPDVPELTLLNQWQHQMDMQDTLLDEFTFL